MFQFTRCGLSRRQALSAALVQQAKHFLHLCRARLRSRQMARPAFLFGALILVFAGAGHGARADEMSFSIATIGDPSICGRTCPAIITAEGEITNATPTAFVDFLQHNALRSGLHAVVLLNSPGGKVVASMEFGKILRRLGAAVIVARAEPSASGALLAGRCFSACVYAFMGGKKRVIPIQSEVGIHRMFTYEYAWDGYGILGGRRRRFDNGGMAAVLSRYSGMMGISPQLISTAEHITPDRLHIMSRAEIARWNLAASRF
ncbi:MAG: hypothetical protein ACLPID_07820 [Beijerinckiaceae bacterium]